jgi:hypothetical protein
MACGTFVRIFCNLLITQRPNGTRILPFFVTSTAVLTPFPQKCDWIAYAEMHGTANPMMMVRLRLQSCERGGVTQLVEC